MKILYFAWLRERLNKSEETVTPPVEVKSVGDLINWLAANDEAASMAFANPKVIRAAIDTEIVPHDALIAQASVIALFPPMTGG
jgi:molybdopterin synthase sulfur carrier subunit